MSLFKEGTVYFAKAGEQNTDALLEALREYIEKEDVKDIVVASTTGATGARVAEVFRSRNVVVVTHHFGFEEPGKSELLDEYKRRILASGAKIFAGTHALSGAERAVRKDFGAIQPLELMANVLRLMGEGTKVCVEISLMAADAGLIPVDQDVIAIGGTGQGADTALRVRPANTGKFFDFKIRQVVAKPNDF